MMSIRQEQKEDGAESEKEQDDDDDDEPPSPRAGGLANLKAAKRAQESRSTLKTQSSSAALDAGVNPLRQTDSSTGKPSDLSDMVDDDDETREASPSEAARTKRGMKTKMNSIRKGALVKMGLRKGKSAREAEGE